MIAVNSDAAKGPMMGRAMAGTDTWGPVTECPPLPFTGMRCANPEPLPHAYCWAATCYVADSHDLTEGVQT